MRRLFQASLAVLAMLAFGATNASAWGDVEGYQYAVKFVCGTPGDYPSPVAPAHYRTAINIANGNDWRTVTTRLIVPTHPADGYTWIAPSKLDIFGGEEVDCHDIRSALYLDKGAFIKGIYYVRSCKRPLDVIAVYSSNKYVKDDGVTPITLDVETAKGRSIFIEDGDCEVRYRKTE